MKNTSALATYQKKQKGMTFLEVLIALVILVTGILGAVALQAVAKKSSFDAMQRSVASSLAQDIVERMRGNSSANLDDYIGTYASGTALSAPTNDCGLVTTDCDNSQLAAYDLYEWEQSLLGASTKYDSTKNAGGLSNGVGCIDVAGNSVTVAITWQGKTEVSDGASSSFGVACGSTTSDKKRRQVVINAYIL